LQRGVVVEDRDFGAPRDDREGDEGGRRRQDRGDHEHQLVHPGGDDVLLERQLERVGDRLQQAERAGPVRARPVLHPGDDPALRPDHEHRREQQEEEDDADLEQHHPPDELVEVAQRGVSRGRRQRVRQRPIEHHSGLLRVTVAPCPAPSRAAMVGPAWAAASASPGYGAIAALLAGRPAAGSQTTWSAIGTTATGTVTDPRSVATVTLSPSATPASAAVAGDIRATAGRAVPARAGSPSCIRPLSSSWCHVASFTSSRPDPCAWWVRCTPESEPAPLTSGGSGRVPRQVPSAASSARAAAASGRPRWTSIWSAIAPSTYRSVRTSGTRSAASNEPPRPSQFTNVPAFSATAATGKTTSARSVTALARSSRLTTNGAISIACSAATGSGRSAGSTPATTRAPSSPCRAAASIAAVSRPGVPGRELLPQVLATSARAAGSSAGRPIGSSPGRAPASTAPRPPPSGGTQATPP